ncbi:PAS domain-containing protein [Devosia epidermidihirudinis]|uniref:PAS domain-containing protein n=1 Tax=Devosia epidermidihirudinis TaxID=1293439 RepID=UPI0009E55188|nr:PAS domain-containing protein [Devosia epidermidihirudinis]
MASVESSASSRLVSLFSAQWSRPILVGLVVGTLCLLGILTRPVGLLAMIWPANAVMLGLLIRFPGLNRASVWAAAMAAYVIADLLLGTSLEKAFLLNAANLCGVGAGYLVWRLLPPNKLSMREPVSALYLIVVATAAAAIAGVIGTVAGAVLLGLDVADAWVFWFVTELVNYIALLPVVLSAPSAKEFTHELKLPDLRTQLPLVLPALSLAVSCIITIVMNGPGAIAFVVPALVWCGLSYQVFVVSLLSLAINYWSQTVLTTAYLHDVIGPSDERELVSMRLVALMIALAPLILSIVMRSRDELVNKLSLARQRVDMAMDAGGIVATWELDFARGKFMVEGKLAKLVGWEGRAHTGIPLDDLLKSIYRDDRDLVQEALRTASATGSDYYCRYRMQTSSGDIRWFAAFGKLVRDKRNILSQLVGISIDVTEEAEAFEALEQSNRRFNIVSESIPQIVWSTDAKGRHDYFNCRWTEFTGIAADSITADTWKGLVHADDRARVEQVWRDCIATGNTYSLDYRFRYRDGSYRWLKVLAKPLRNSDGVITRWYGTSTDIDDAKQLEAEREIVASELDHRIGNLFALVNGLVALTLRDASDVKEATGELRARLSALYDAHTLIRRKSDEGLTVTELLGQLLAPYKNGDAAITITGDDLPVAPSAVTAVALVFHELATNAVKYGALKDGQGDLRIELCNTGERYAIRWLEMTQSPAQSSQGTGFGSKLFNSIVEGQLRGLATRSIAPDGLTIHIDLPIPSLSGTTKQQS